MNKAIESIFSERAIENKLKGVEDIPVNETFKDNSWKKRFRSLERAERRAARKREKRFIRGKWKKIHPNLNGKDYRDYMKSQRWKGIRKAYWSKHPKKCVACKGTWKVGLHHLSYKNLGCEPDEDLIALCWECHKGYHYENGVARESRDSTYQYIIGKHEANELAEIVKNF